jgi:hypothetical protein
VDRFPWKAAAQHIPRVGCDRAPWPNHARHFGSPFGWIRKKEDHQRHNRGIKPVVREWECQCVTLEEIGSLRCGPVPRESKLSFRWVNSIHLCWSTSLDEQFGKSAVATADIYPAQARGRRQPVEKLFTCESAPDTHCALVDVPVIEMDRLVSHYRQPPVAHASLVDKI